MSPFTVSHSREEETPEAKARWFQSLTLEERMAYLDFITELVLENNPNAMRDKDAQPVPGRVQVLSAP